MTGWLLASINNFSRPTFSTRRSEELLLMTMSTQVVVNLTSHRPKAKRKKKKLRLMTNQPTNQHSYTDSPIKASAARADRRNSSQ
jgi:hypothetical protein